MAPLLPDARVPGGALPRTAESRTGGRRPRRATRLARHRGGCAQPDLGTRHPPILGRRCLSVDSLRLVWIHLRLGVLNELQYRTNLVVQIIQSVVGLATALLGLSVVFSKTDNLAG